MNIGPRQRWIALIGLLTATLTAAAWVRDGERNSVQEIVEPPARVRPAQDSRRREIGRPEVLNLDKLKALEDGANAGDPFAPKSWRRPAPVVAAPAAPVAMAPPPPPPPPPAVPSAPPLPFAYMGKLMSEETRTVYLTQGERSLVVQEGEAIGSDYRMDRITETRLTFTHLPSGLQQHLSIGESQ